MTSQPTAEQIKTAARIIRENFPIDYTAKGRTVDEAIRRQNQAIRDQLEAWGMTWSTVNNYGTTVEGRHVWHTAICEDEDGNPGRLSGRWSDNAVECELHLRMYAEYDIPMQVFEDPECTLYNKLKSQRIAAEKQVRAIERKAQKVEAKHTDTTTTKELLDATVSDGMLF